MEETFAKTEKPLGCYFAGEFSDGREQFDFYKKSAEAGCSWGQMQYADCFKEGLLVEKDENLYLEWLKKAAKQNNPEALYWLGSWFELDSDEDDGDEKAVSLYLAAAQLGWKNSMYWLAIMLKDGVGCEKDLRQAVIWSAQSKKSSDVDVLWTILGEEARAAYYEGTTNDLGCDFDQLCYSIGWGLYWYQYGDENWNDRTDNEKSFGSRCLDYYCSCVELQQKSIFTFLLCWNRTMGVKDVGPMIAKIVWEDREDNLMKLFDPGIRKKSEAKRKKVKRFEEGFFLVMNMQKQMEE